MAYNTKENQQMNYMGSVPPPPGMPIAWMQRPAAMQGCPPGLEYLSLIDRLQVKQVVSLLEAFTGWDTNNKYEIQNAAGQRVYFAAEDTETCMRVCCKQGRGFTINIIDNLNQVVMKMRRDFKCCACSCSCFACCDCCAHEVIVEAPAGNIIGYVKQQCSFWKASYDILDENHQTLLKIKGPCCIFDGPLSCCCDNKFNVYSLDGNEIGLINKVYSGFVKEAYTVADNFGINFPADLSVNCKATLLAALFLIVIYSFIYL